MGETCLEAWLLCIANKIELSITAHDALVSVSHRHDVYVKLPAPAYKAEDRM